MREKIRKSLLKLEKLRCFIGKLPSRLISRSNLLVYMFIVTYIIVFSYYTILKHHAFLSSVLDLGVYDQAIWSLLHGKLLYYTAEFPMNPSNSVFGVHFTPILFLIAPIYALYPVPETLLVLQSFALALGALPLYWLARDEIGELAALILSSAYLLNPLLHSINCFDFHPEAFIPALLFFTFYYFKREKWIISFAFTILALMCMENMPFIIIFFGLYGLATSISYAKMRFIVKKTPFLYSLSLVLLSVMWFILAMKTIELFNPSRYAWAVSAWSNWGSSIAEIAINVLTHPIDAITFVLSSPQRISILLCLFAPVAFLPLSSLPELLLSLPWLVPALLAEKPYPAIGYQYAGFIIAQIFIATIYGIKRLSRSEEVDTKEGWKEHILKQILFPHQVDKPLDPYRKMVHTKIAALVFISTFILFIALSPLTLDSYGIWPDPKITSHEELLSKIIQLIPPNASVFTQDNIFPHLSHRLEVYYCRPPIEVDYMLVDLTSPYCTENMWFPPPFNTPEYEVALSALNEGKYGILVSADGILLLKKNFQGPPILYQPYVRIYDYRDLKLLRGSIINDPTSASGKVLIHRGGDGEGFFYGPYDRLPPGEYIATYRLKVSTKNNAEHLLTLDVMVDMRDVIAHRNVYGGDFAQPNTWENITIHFVTKKPAISEFRAMYVSQSSDIYLDRIEVRQVSLRTDVLPFQENKYNFFELTLANGRVENHVLIHTTNDAPGTFWYGPYVTLPLGTYKVTYWLKISKPATGHVMTLDVSAELGKKELGKYEVNASEFISLNQWNGFKITFTVDEVMKAVEFRGLDVSNITDIYLNFIEVKRLE